MKAQLLRKILTKTSLSSDQDGLKVKSRTQELADCKDVPENRQKAVSNVGYVDIATMLAHTSNDARVDRLTGTEVETQSTQDTVVSFS
jgi:hypothetical protein